MKVFNIKRMYKVVPILALLVVAAPIAYAQTTKDSELTQVINTGALSTNINDTSDDPVANPAFPMSAVGVSTSQQTSTGTFGDNNQRIAVDNPESALDGWGLSIAGTAGAGTEMWDSGSNTYAFDGTAANGQLTLDPSAASLTVQIGSSTGISTGTVASFSSGSVDSIELLSASSGADTIWRGYITGVGVSQTIPAGQPAGTYSLDLTQTVVAL